MNCDIDDYGPDVATKHGHFHKCPEVVSLQGCCFSLIFSHITIFLVDEVFIRIQEVTSLNIYLLYHREHLYTPQQKKHIREDNDRFRDLHDFEHVK